MGTSRFPTLGFDPCPGDPVGVTTLARKWQDAAFLLAEIAVRLDGTDEVQVRWRGQAADAFRSRLNGNRVTIGKLRASYEHNADLLRTWAGRLKEFQAEAAALEVQAAGLDERRRRATVSPQATPLPVPEAPPTLGRATPAPPTLEQLQTQLSGLHTRAGQLQERYLAAAGLLARKAGSLRHLPAGITGWYGQSVDTAQEAMLLRQEAGRKGGPVPVDPALRAGWWNSLTPDEQAAMAHDYPTAVGSANGLPAEARNAANMLLLKQYRDQDQAAYERLKAAQPPDSAAIKSARDRYHSIRDLYDSLTSPGNPDYRRPSYLLGIDQNGPQGHAIVCYGNPDTSSNTAVYVPGTGSNLDGIGGDAGRARDIYDAAQKSDPGSTASMVWLGYDAPQSLYKDAPFRSWADNGAPLLSDYVNSLALTHQGPSHVTVIGHSYGSTLVGDAAGHHGMHADDIVVVGSPGLTVDHASDLHMDPNHVWAGKMANDLVPPASLPLNPLKWRDDYSERFGTDPTSSDFGGRAFASGYGEVRPDKSHSDYWHSDQPSFANMTRIVTGHPQDVTVPSTAERDGTFPTGTNAGSGLQLVGGIEQDLGHAIPGGYGAPLEHTGAAHDELGHGANAVVGGTEDLITGDLDGAGHQFGDATDDAAGAVKDATKAIIDPFTGW